MPFFFWLPFLLYDLHDPVTKEYYVQFGFGPGHQTTAYSLEGERGRLNGVGAAGVARFGVLMTPKVGFYLAASGNGFAPAEQTAPAFYAGRVGHGLDGLGLGGHYQVGDFRFGLGAYYADVGISAVGGERSGEALYERGGAAGELFVEYVFAENALGKQNAWDRFKYRGSVSVNTLAHANGSANVALLLNGSVGYAPLRAEK